MKNRINSIKDFLNIKPLCFCCGNTMQLSFCINGIVFTKNNHLLLNNSYLYKKENANSYFSKYKSQFMTDTSNNSLKLFKEGDLICNIDLNTEINSVSFRSFNHILHHNDVKLVSSCYNTNCSTNSVVSYSSSKLYLDIKNNRIFPFTISLVDLGIKLNDSVFILNANYNFNSTQLYELDTDKDRKFKFGNWKRLLEIPIIDIISINDLDTASNKIKTILAFN